MRFQFELTTKGAGERHNDRDAAVLAFAEGAKEMLGEARFSADPDNRAAELAIAVRSDPKLRLASMTLHDII